MSEDSKAKAEAAPAKKGGKKGGDKKEKKPEAKAEAKAEAAPAAAGEAKQGGEKKAKKPKKEKKEAAPAAEAKGDAKAAEPKKEEKAAPAAPAAPEPFAIAFTLSAASVGEAKNTLIKSKVKDAFFGYGALDEVRVTGDSDADRICVIFITRVLSKGEAIQEKLKKGDKVTINIFSEEVELFLSDARGSGGGATSGTSYRPKNEEKKKSAGRGRGRGKEGEAGAAPGGKPEGRERKKSPPRIGPIGRASGGPSPGKFILPEKALKAKLKKEEEAKKEAKAKQDRKEGNDPAPATKGKAPAKAPAKKGK
jgi:hypothetical protein